MSVERAKPVQPAMARVIALAYVALLAVSSTANAAWLGYKNESKYPMMVQTTTVVNNVVVRGKAHALFPGEVAWDNIAVPGVRQISVYDPKANNKLMHQENVTIQNQDLVLGVRVETPAQQPGKPAPVPQVKLVATKVQGPAGVPQQNSKPKSTTPTPPIPPRPSQETPKSTPPATNPSPPAIPVKPNSTPPSNSSGKTGN